VPPLTAAKTSPVNHTMLYIEDHAVTRRLVEIMLLKFRPQIALRLAANARDGVQAAIDERPGLILLDNRLPDATAGEVLRQLASSEATAGIPVIVISGDSAKTGDELLAIGASEFLPKPFDIDQLVIMIDRYIH
jgi:CheY-like chemotaxis protein